MSGIPWPSEVLGMLDEPLRAVLNSPAVTDWIAPSLAWLLVALVCVIISALWRAQWAVMMAPQRAAEAQQMAQQQRAFENLAGRAAPAANKREES